MHMPTTSVAQSLGKVPRLALFLVVVCAGVCVSGESLADIYQYTDADGVIHFTNTKQASGSGYSIYLKGEGNLRNRVGVAVPPSDREVDRFTRYDDWIRQASGLYQIPEQLVRAVIKVESDYDPRATSIAGARGLMQLMPETASRLLVKDIDDPRENIFGGVRYLRILANTFNGDLALTIAGYNAGEGAVRKYGGVPPYAETRGYVNKVSHYYRRYRHIVDPVKASLGSD
jgi:soluble lytic murein transglycosylase-like protein